MRNIVLLLVACTIAVIASCTKDPTDTDGEYDLVPDYEGTFLIVSELASNTCLIPVPPDDVINISIQDDTIYFGSFAGDWDESTLTGSGTTPETTVPVDPPECYSYYTITFEITYADEDSFSGTYGSDFRKDAGCSNPDPCSFRYNITGTRQ